MEDDYNSQEDININRQYNYDYSQQQNNSSNNEKGKRHRRGKGEANGERTHKCPDCDKCYLSGPALIIHRKTKHGFSTDGEKKARGRPKASDQSEISYRKAKSIYDSFLNNENRKKRSEYEIIDLDVVKENFRTIFRELKFETFKELNSVNDYPLYQLVTNLWTIEDPALAKECFSEATQIKKENNEIIKNCPNPPMEQVFYLYLKFISGYTNKNYFGFVQKFIVLYREYINNFKKTIVKDEYKSGKDNTFSQLFSAEGIPESCNDFFLEFLQPKAYFGNKGDEFIELAQHFCFWLYSKRYTQPYLTRID